MDGSGICAFLSAVATKQELKMALVAINLMGNVDVQNLDGKDIIVKDPLSVELMKQHVKMANVF